MVQISQLLDANNTFYGSLAFNIVSSWSKQEKYFDSFYGPFYGWNTHSLLFSNILLMHYQSSTDAIWKKIILSGTQKTASIAVTLVLFPNPRYFFSSACFCVRFLGKIMCLRKCWCFLQGWYLCNQLSTFSENMFFNELTRGQFFCTDKL